MSASPTSAWYFDDSAHRPRRRLPTALAKLANISQRRADVLIGSISWTAAEPTTRPV